MTHHDMVGVRARVLLCVLEEFPELTKPWQSLLLDTDTDTDTESTSTRLDWMSSRRLRPTSRYTAEPCLPWKCLEAAVLHFFSRSPSTHRLIHLLPFIYLALAIHFSFSVETCLQLDLISIISYRFYLDFKNKDLIFAWMSSRTRERSINRSTFGYIQLYIQI